MPDDLTELLGSLLAGPDPVLASSSDVRARGDQRRRRRHALVASAAALVVAAGAGTAVALATPGKPDALQVTHPTPTEAPSAGGLVGTQALLQHSDAEAVSPGAWQQPDDPGVDALSPLQPCEAGSLGGATGTRWSLNKGLSAYVASTVLRVGPGGATGWVDALADDVTQCPVRRDDTTTTTLTTASRAPGELVVHEVLTTARGLADEGWWLVVGRDDLVSLTKVSASERARTAAWSGAARARLSSCGAWRCEPRTAPRRPEGWPAGLERQVGRTSFAVYLSGRHYYADPDRERLAQSALLRAALLGYEAHLVMPGCDGVERRFLPPGVAPSTPMAAVYFPNRVAAQAFRDRWLPEAPHEDGPVPVSEVLEVRPGGC